MKHDHLFRDTQDQPIAMFMQHAGASRDTMLDAIPDYMRPEFVRYVLMGIKPGSFLRAIFAGEKSYAERRADDRNRFLIDTYFALLMDECPTDCWGSAARVQAWVERGGLLGHHQIGDDAA